MEKIKVALITYSLCDGGTEKRILNLASYLSTQNIIVDIISLKRVNIYEKEYTKLFKRVRVFYLSDLQETVPLLKKPFVFVKMIVNVFKLARREKYSVVFGFDYYAWHFTHLLKALFKIRTINVVCIALTHQINEFHFIARHIHKTLFNILFRSANKIICISDGVAYDLQTLYAVPEGKIAVIHNGVDIRKIRHDIVGVSKAKERIIITCGRLVEQKGQVYLIQAFSKLSKRYPDMKLHILGVGPLEKQLKNYVEKLGLRKRVLFMGFKDNPYKYLAKSTIFVLPSLYEGFANVIIEAMVCGLPVISTDCPYGPREILSAENIKYPMGAVNRTKYEKYGVLIPPPSVNLLAKSMERLIENTTLQGYYTRSNLSRINYFSLRLMGKQYLFQIETLVNIRQSM